MKVGENGVSGDSLKKAAAFAGAERHFFGDHGNGQRLIVVVIDKVQDSLYISVVPEMGNVICA